MLQTNSRSPLNPVFAFATVIGMKKPWSKLLPQELYLSALGSRAQIMVLRAAGEQARQCEVLVDRHPKIVVRICISEANDKSRLVVLKNPAPLVLLCLGTNEDIGYAFLLNLPHCFTSTDSIICLAAL